MNLFIQHQEGWIALFATSTLLIRICITTVPPDSTHIPTDMTSLTTALSLKPYSNMLQQLVIRPLILHSTLTIVVSTLILTSTQSPIPLAKPSHRDIDSKRPNDVTTYLLNRWEYCQQHNLLARCEALQNDPDKQEQIAQAIMRDLERSALAGGKSVARHSLTPHNPVISDLTTDIRTIKRTRRHLRRWRQTTSQNYIDLTNTLTEKLKLLRHAKHTSDNDREHHNLT